MNKISRSSQPHPWQQLGCAFLMISGSFLLVGGFYFFMIDGDETSPSVYEVYLADLNGDTHLDAFVIYLNEMQRVMLNDGQGHFVTDRELLMFNYVMALGDINGDGQLDAILKPSLECKTTAPDLVVDDPLDSESLQAFAMQDRNRDGIPEAFVGGCCRHTTTLISRGEFTGGSSCLGTQTANAVALADLNGDGALDAFLANGTVYLDEDKKVQRDRSNEVWFNDGAGKFYDSSQRLGSAESYAVGLGDVNGDGFTDAVVGNQGPGEIWLNDGLGNFTSSGQRLGSGLTDFIFLADLDGDRDPDLFAGDETSGWVWLNDGSGFFQRGQHIRYGRKSAVALGDVTGDGVVDVFIANVESYQVWYGDGSGRFSAAPRNSQ